MNFSSKHIEDLINEFAKLPGVGRKTATRYVLHILKQDDKETENFAAALISLRRNLKHCSICHNISDKEICNICSNHHRDKTSLCIVEDIRDVMAIESTQQYRGVYHVLGGIISPLDGIGPDQIRLQELLERLDTENISEIILALDADLEGDATSLYLTKLIKPKGVRVTRIAHGVPIGGNLEYVDYRTLSRALENRIEM